MAGYSIVDLKKKIHTFSKKDLIQRPTPFYKCENLSRVLGGPQIFIKRDDLTGLAFGGNKSRKLEYIMQDILDKGADVVVTWAALQSNWCLQTAAAAKKYGIKPILVLFKTYDLPEEYDGNLLLDYLLGADIRIRDAEKGQIIREEEAEELLADVISEVIQQGLKPYFAPIGGSMVGGSMDVPLGAIGYVDAYVEMIEQASELDVEVNYVLHASGSGGTQAGLIVGAVAMGKKVKVIGISVSEDKKSYGWDMDKLFCRIAIDFIQHRYSNIIDTGEFLKRSLRDMENDRETDCIKIYWMIGDSYHKQDYIYESIEFYKKALDIDVVWGEKGYSSNERTGIRPSLDVNGIWGGYTGEGAKTVIASKAYAKISMRLVPDQDNEKISKLFEEHFKSIAPPCVKVKVTALHGGQGYVSPTDIIAYKAADMAYHTVYGKKPVPVRSGGSIPIISTFEDKLGIKSILMGFGLESDAIHSPNENFPVNQFFNGIETISYFYKYFTELMKG